MSEPVRPTEGRRILIGVSAGIAAYKVPDIVRRLRERGCQVRVVMTAAAKAFITPMTLQAVSGYPVHEDLFDLEAEAAMGHIELAKWAEEILIAPASADILARLTAGMANDLLSTVCLASQARLSLAPAMNQQMWQAPAVQDNMRVLKARGVRCLGPGYGSQACGDVGYGRMLEPEDIVEQLLAQAVPQIFKGQRILITAGPTQEPIDPVRFISNHSSGKMGFALASAAKQMGAAVTLVAGPVSLSTPEGVQRVDVQTADEMQRAVEAQVCDIFIGAAAVCDHRPAQFSLKKQSKSALQKALAWVETPDIISQVAKRTPRPFVVGFAAQTHHVIEYAREKLQQKQLDMIIANQVGGENLGFNSEYNCVELLWSDQQHALPQASKVALAFDILKSVHEVYTSVRAPLSAHCVNETAG